MDLRDTLDALKNGDEIAQDENLEAAPEQAENLEATSEEVTEEVTEDVQTEEQPQAVDLESVELKEVAEEWKPSLKFKVLKEEHDFPEWTRDFVNSREVEENFVDLLTKANALEHQKKRRGEIEDQYAELKTTYDARMDDATELAKIVQDYNSKLGSNDPSEQFLALRDAGLNEKAVLDIARHVLELQKLSPAQRQAHDLQFQQQSQIETYNQQLAQTQQQLQQTQAQAAQAQLSSFLSSRSDIVSEYEKLEGNNEGEFQNDFINFGLSLQSKLGREVEWKDAFKQFKKVHGLGRAKSKPAPKSLPNLRSTGHSPVEKAFNTMDDLRKHMSSKY